MYTTLQTCFPETTALQEIDTNKYNQIQTVTTLPELYVIIPPLRCDIPKYKNLERE